MPFIKSLRISSDVISFYDNHSTFAVGDKRIYQGKGKFYGLFKADGFRAYCFPAHMGNKVEIPVQLHPTYAHNGGRANTKGFHGKMIYPLNILRHDISLISFSVCRLSYRLSFQAQVQGRG